MIGFPSYRGEVKFTTKKIAIVACISIIAGTVASMIGIGGGVIYVPVLLILGYPPFVAGSTSMLMVMYSSTATFISYNIIGNVNVGYAFWLALWSTIGVVFGVTGANKIVQKTGRQSIFIILLGVVLILIIVISVVFNTLNTIGKICLDIC
jgi:uncharacterized membrane protein YfcA